MADINTPTVVVTPEDNFEGHPLFDGGATDQTYIDAINKRKTRERREAFQAERELDSNITPVEPTQQQTKEDPNQEDTLTGVLDVARGATEIGGQVIGGGIDAVNETIDLGVEFSNWLNENAFDPEGNNNFEKIAIPNPIGEADSDTGKAVRDISRFLTGFLGAGKIKPLKEVGKLFKSPVAGKAAESVAKGSVGDFLVSKEGEKNLSNIIKDLGAEAEFLDYLATEPSEGADASFGKILTDKLKFAVEGSVLGLTVEGLVKAAKVVRAARIASRNDKAKAIKELEAEKAIERETLSKVAFQRGELDRIFGDPTKPAFEIKKPTKIKESELISPTAKAAAKDSKDQVFINWSRLNTEEDVKSLLQALADASKKGIDKARGGAKQTFKQVEMSASEQQTWDLLAKNSPEVLNASETFALRKLWVSSGEKVQELAIAASRNPSEMNSIALERMLAVHETIQQRVIGVRTAQARALNQWRMPAGGAADFKSQMDTLSELSGRYQGATQKLADKIALLAEGGRADAIPKLISSGVYAKTSAGMVQLFYFSVLSSPRTHVRNIIGNATVLALTAGERKMASLLGKLKGEQNVADEEAITGAIAGLQSIKDAFRLTREVHELTGVAERGSFWRALKTGESGFGVGKIELPQNGAFSREALGDNPISGLFSALDMISSSTTRLLAAEDEMFSTMNYAAELSMLAVRRARQEVNAGRIPEEAFTSRVKEIKSDPTEFMKISARGLAKRNTFTEVPENTAVYKAWKSLSKLPILGKLAVAFRKTPYNIGKYTFEHSPLAPISKRFRDDIEAGGARADLAWGRFLIGNALLLIGADAALSGQTEGGVRAETAKGQTMQRAGISPSSMQVGEDTRITTGSLEPASFFINVPATLVQVYNTDTGDLDEEEINEEKLAVAATLAIVDNLFNQSYMRGTSTIVNAVSNASKGQGQFFFNSLAKLTVPNIVSDVERAISPEVSYVTDAASAAKSRIPWFSEGVPKKHDAWGKVIKYDSGIGWLYDMTSPVFVTNAKPQPIDKYLIENEFYIATPSLRMSFGKDPTNEANAQNGKYRPSVNMFNFPKEYQDILEMSGSLTATENGEPIESLGFTSSGGTLLEELNMIVQGRHPHLPAEQWNSWAGGKDGMQHKVIKGIVRAYREEAKKQVLKRSAKLLDLVERKNKKPMYNYEQ